MKLHIPRLIRVVYLGKTDWTKRTARNEPGETNWTKRTRRNKLWAKQTKRAEPGETNLGRNEPGRN